jgi:hypothetical protein
MPVRYHHANTSHLISSPRVGAPITSRYPQEADVNDPCASHGGPHHLIGARITGCAPRLINTARGSIVDEGALVDALKQESSPARDSTFMNGTGHPFSADSAVVLLLIWDPPPAREGSDGTGVFGCLFAVLHGRRPQTTFTSRLLKTIATVEMNGLRV